jgi:hypothetical protein
VNTFLSLDFVKCKVKQEAPHSSSMFSHTIAREIFTNLKFLTIV